MSDSLYADNKPVDRETSLVGVVLLCALDLLSQKRMDLIPSQSRDEINGKLDRRS